MKTLCAFFLFSLLYSCVNEDNSSSNPDAQSTVLKDVSATKAEEHVPWIISLREFRDAVYQDDLEKIKSFVDFPLQSENNALWLLAKTNEGEYPDVSAPFTEIDFDENYKTFFDATFIKTLLKVKTQILFDTGKSETPKVYKNEVSWSIMYADFDKKARELYLLLYSEELMYETDSDFEIPEDQVIESSIRYRFKISKLGHLKFLGVDLAG